MSVLASGWLNSAKDILTLHALMENDIQYSPPLMTPELMQLDLVYCLSRPVAVPFLSEQRTWSPRSYASLSCSICEYRL
jgi:hypothetical protein